MMSQHNDFFDKAKESDKSSHLTEEHEGGTLDDFRSRGAKYHFPALDRQIYEAWSIKSHESGTLLKSKYVRQTGSRTIISIRQESRYGWKQYNTEGKDVPAHRWFLWQSQESHMRSHRTEEHQGGTPGDFRTKVPKCHISALARQIYEAKSILSEVWNITEIIYIKTTTG